MVDIESKIISYREDTNDYRLCLTREEIEEIKNIRPNTIEECISTLKASYPLVDDNDILYGFGCAIHRLEQLKEQNK